MFLDVLLTSSVLPLYYYFYITQIWGVAINSDEGFSSVEFKIHLQSQL